MRHRIVDARRLGHVDSMRKAGVTRFYTGRTCDENALSVYGYGNFAVRDDRCRYIVHKDGAEELYDHATE